MSKLPKHKETAVNQVHYNMLAKGAESHAIPTTKYCLLLHIKEQPSKLTFQQPSPDGHG